MARKRPRTQAGDGPAEGLPNPYPSSPRRLPTHYIDIRGGDRRYSTTFSAQYAAKHYVDHAIGDSKVKWSSHEDITTDEVTIHSPELEDIMEHEFTPEEEAWVLPDQYRREIFYITTGRRLKAKSPSSPDKSAVPTPPAPNGANGGNGARRKSADGLVTISEICGRIGVEPSKARRILRASTQLAHASKGRWAWPESDVQAIIKIITGKK